MRRRIRTHVLRSLESPAFLMLVGFVKVYSVREEQVGAGGRMGQNRLATALSGFDVVVVFLVDKEGRAVSLVRRLNQWEYRRRFLCSNSK